MGLDRKGGKRRDGVDAARAEENETGAVSLAVFEEIDGAAEVVFDELARAGFAVDAGEDAGVGGGVDDPIDGREGFEVAGGAEVAVEEFDADFFRASRFDSLPGRMKLSKPKRAWPAPDSASERARVLPTKPHAPEIKIRMGGTVAKIATGGKRDFWEADF